MADAEEVLWGLRYEDGYLRFEIPSDAAWWQVIGMAAIATDINQKAMREAREARRDVVPPKGIQAYMGDLPFKRAAGIMDWR